MTWISGTMSTPSLDHTQPTAPAPDHERPADLVERVAPAEATIGWSITTRVAHTCAYCHSMYLTDDDAVRCERGYEDPDNLAANRDAVGCSSPSLVAERPDSSRGVVDYVPRSVPHVDDAQLTGHLDEGWHVQLRVQQDRTPVVGDPIAPAAGTEF